MAWSELEQPYLCKLLFPIYMTLPALTFGLFSRLTTIKVGICPCLYIDIFDQAYQVSKIWKLKKYTF